MAALAHNPVHANAANHEGDHGFRKIKQYLPWIKYPLVVNAPMGEFTSPELIASVLKAGGHGQHGTINIPDRLPHDLEAIKKVIDADPVLKGYSDKIEGRLPISLGFLIVYGNLDKLTETVAKYKPAVIWLFAARTIKDYKEWATAMRAASPGTKIWVQAGSIATITRLAHNVQPDVIVVQGSDAGGHGLENGAGIVSILPEAADTLAAQGHGDIPLLASGGIVEGRGVAACIALGAAGVVMGTRFLASPEAVVHPILANRIIAATDGGQSTIRTKVFDDLMGGSWPGEYDSRGLRIKATESSTGAANDVDINEITDMHKEITRKPGGGYSDDNAICWAGCSVGLVNRHQSAFDITNEVREQAIKVLKTGLGKCEIEPN